MTLEEAIKYQEADKSGVVFNQQARQLGIEALWLLINLRSGHDVSPNSLLPSETEEYIPRNVGILPSDDGSSLGETEGEK